MLQTRYPELVTFLEYTVFFLLPNSTYFHLLKHTVASFCAAIAGFTAKLLIPYIPFVPEICN